MWGAPAAQLARTGIERRRRAYGLLALAVILFGTAWPTMKLGLEGGATPMWFAAARAVLGAVASFSALLALGSLRRPGREDLPIILSIGLLQVAAFFVLSNLGLQLVPAGRSVVLAYTTSLWLVPVAALSGEQVSLHRLAGVVVGLGGVTVLLSPFASDWTRTDVLVGHICLLLAALAWALAIFHARRHGWGRLTPMQALPWQMLLAAAVLTGRPLRRHRLADPDPLVSERGLIVRRRRKIPQGMAELRGPG